MRHILFGYWHAVILVLLIGGCDQPTPSPTPTPTPAQKAVGGATPSQSASPLVTITQTVQSTGTPTMLTFRGATGYIETREYEVDYDPAWWQLIDDPSSNPHPLYEKRLQNRLDVGCSIGLLSGPRQLTITDRIELAGREWRLAAMDAIVDQTQTPIIEYSTDATDPTAGLISYFFTVFLPSSDDPQSQKHCRQQAETVIDTFRIVDSIRQP